MKHMRSVGFALAAAFAALAGGKEKDRDREKIEEIKREIELLKTRKKD